MPTKVHLVKAMVFPVVMYGCESWTVKKAECRKIDAFELWCWGRLLRVPWTARRSNQSILKEISPGCSLEGLMLKQKLQYFGRLTWRVDSLEKTLMLGGIGGRRRRGWQRMRWLDGITESMDMSLSKHRELVVEGGLACCDSWGGKGSDTTEQLNWTEAYLSHIGFKNSRKVCVLSPLVMLPFLSVTTSRKKRNHKQKVRKEQIKWYWFGALQNTVCPVSTPLAQGYHCSSWNKQDCAEPHHPPHTCTLSMLNSFVFFLNTSP